MDQRHTYEPDIACDGRTCRICGLLPGGDTHFSDSTSEEFRPCESETSGATSNELKRSYKRVAKRVDPDKAENGADRVTREHLVKNSLFHNLEIQLLYQQELVRIAQEVFPELEIPTIPDGFLDGMEFLFSLRPTTLRDLGLNSDQRKLLDAVTYLLDQCKRIEATEQTLGMIRPLFQPVHPVTPESANAYEEVVQELFDGL